MVFGGGVSVCNALKVELLAGDLRAAELRRELKLGVFSMLPRIAVRSVDFVCSFLMDHMVSIWMFPIFSQQLR